MTAPPDQRHLTLDVIRGVAVMGILLINIVAFAMPPEALINPLAYRGDGPADLAVWAANFVLSEGKFRGLFSVLFGASMLLVVERAEAKSESGALTHYSRLSWLLLFGAIHAWAIWFGDILMLYAVTGAIAFLFRAMTARQLLIVGLGLIVAQAAMFGLDVFEWRRLRETVPPGEWREIAGSFGRIDPAALADDLAIHRGSWRDILANSLGPGFWRPIDNNLAYITETLGLMLIGMAGYRSGFLTGAWSAALYRRLMTIGYAIGLPLLSICALMIFLSGFEVVTTLALDLVVKTLVNPLVILGHASLIILWVRASPGAALVGRVAATGRAAFTNYLGASILCTTIFYGYGLGLYGKLSRAELYLVVPLVWALMLLWSKPWLDRFRYGPFEWLWRSLARRRLQPMRKG